jgi:hypothetical protein
MTNETPEPAAQPPETPDPVLHRLKELEDSNTQNAKALERMRKEMQDKDEKIKALSADKRKEMETILSSAIDNWLGSLSGVSDENKANFRKGISKLAEEADMNNAAWEIVCNASQLHKDNVQKIEELLTEAKDRERELGDLKGFRTEASRISGVKRRRDEEEAPPPEKRPAPAEPTAKGDIWDAFQSMLQRDIRTAYF